MLDIQFIPIENSQKSFIIIDGYKEKALYEHNRYHLFQTKEVYDALVKCTPQEIAKHFDEISYYDLESPIGAETSTFIHFYASSFNIDLNYSFYLNTWDKGFAFDDFLSVFKGLLFNKYKHQDLGSILDIENVIAISLTFPYEPSPTIHQTEKFTEEINSIIKSAYLLLSTNNENSFISVFKFPESIKTPCQQYLMYFGQFLSDLGIEVETELKEQAHSTLFSVTPKNKNEALDKIKEVLEMYISIPNSDNFSNINSSDIAFIQVQANVMHLKSQIMFANAAIQMKDATIEFLKISNYQIQQQLLTNHTSKHEDEESVIKGIVNVKKYDGNWFSVNLPEILRKLKRKF